MERLYNTKFIQSGDRLEVYKYHGYIRTGKECTNKTGRRGKSELSAEEKEANKIKSRSMCLTNARNNIVRLVNANADMTTFITLTYKENMQDIKKSKRQINAFFQKLKIDYEELKYLYVMEFQERGAIHYHLLTNFPIPIKTNKKPTEKQKEYNLKFMKKYWRYGWCDCRSLKSEENTNIARYISAYITFDLIDKKLDGKRVYAYSRNIEKPKVTTIETKLNYEQLSQIEGYDLGYYSTYEINYKDKKGKSRRNQVNYFDFKIKQ